MKNLKALTIFTILISLSGMKAAYADTIGYADFQKIEVSYNYAQKVAKDLDDKVMALKQYLINKDKEYKAIDSPVGKKNFEEKTQQEYNSKEEAIIKLREEKEKEIFTNIKSASKIVSSQKNVDVVFDSRAVISGGVDLTDDIINYLNNTKPQKNSGKK